MSEFCIIGSGISGATIANLLDKKHSVTLFDKARGPGGRASFKRIKGKIGFDHGTQYISPKTKEFKRFTKDLIKKRILKVWKGKHIFPNSKMGTGRYLHRSQGVSWDVYCDVGRPRPRRHQRESATGICWTYTGPKGTVAQFHAAFYPSRDNN